MRKINRAGLLAVTLATVAAPTALAGGPQLMPDKACNAEDHGGYAAQGYYNVVPHWKDWDGDGTYACYHLNLNPFVPPGDGSLE